MARLYPGGYVHLYCADNAPHPLPDCGSSWAELQLQIDCRQIDGGDVLPGSTSVRELHLPACSHAEQGGVVSGEHEDWEGEGVWEGGAQLEGGMVCNDGSGDAVQ